MPAAPLPLRASTRRLTPDEAQHLAPLLEHADPASPLAWLRRGDGLVGFGREVWRQETRGDQRISEAAGGFAAVCDAALIDDEVCIPGTGLVAFGAFTFAADSTATSSLTVPEFVLGRSGAETFLTWCRPETDAERDASVPASAPSPIPAAGSLPKPAPPANSTLVPAPETAAATGDEPPGHPRGHDTPTSTWRPGSMDHDAHRAAVARALDAIRAGDLEKVVLARDIRTRIAPAADRRAIARAFAERYPDCWTYAVDGLIGASPEMLVRVLDGTVSLRVLAGTVERGSDEASDARAADALRHSAKNLAEHEFAVRSALSSLDTAFGTDPEDTRTRPVPLDPGAGLTASREPFLLRLPNVWHLASDIRGPLPEGCSLLHLVEALHPTAAVGGTPRDAAMRLIAELEEDRGRYAGPVGWLSSSGDGEWAIALRGLEVATDGAVVARAGGGIVAASDPHEEWRETEWKLRPAREALHAVGVAEGDRADGREVRGERCRSERAETQPAE